MAWWHQKEQRSIESPQVPISSPNILQFLGLDNEAVAGESVTVKNALGVPAVWAGINFLSGTLAGLPIHLYQRNGEGRQRARGNIDNLLNSAVNDEMSSFEWRKYVFECVFTEGRSVTFIERNRAGTPINLWPLEPKNVTVKLRNNRKQYQYKQDNGEPITYDASEVIDIPFMLSQDRITCLSPIMVNKHAIGLAQAVTKYGGRFFANGGVPPFAIEGPFNSPGGMQRASDDLANAVKKAAKENRLAVTLPMNHKIHSLGGDPGKSQLIDVQRFSVEQIARIYSLPPTFLQDLTNGTFANTEQQDLHFVKHTLKRWVEQVEQELNLKLFGRTRNARFVEFSLDGMLRGDFKTRMEGYAQAIQHAILKPNEARRRENLPEEPEGDVLMIQGATVPIGTNGEQPNEE